VVFSNFYFANKALQEIIIYNTADGKASVSLYARNGMVWMNQSQLAELFATSKQNIGQHVSNILEENELDGNSVVKNYFTTAADGKQYQVEFYALDMIHANQGLSRLSGQVVGCQLPGKSQCV